MDELTTRFLSACVASAVATIVVTPLDVVKTRLQVATSSTPSWVPIRASKDAFREYQCLAMQTAQKGSFVHNSNLVQLSHVAAHHPATISSLMAMCPKAAAATRERIGLTATFKKIVKEEGVRALWKGLDTAMLLNIPMVSVYMVLYDTLHSQLSKDMGMYAPAVAGMAARTATVLATAPLELVRTRQQASSVASRTMSSLVASWQGGSSGIKGFRASLAGVQSLWTGVSATLARDVPFTILYWCLVEPTRAHLLRAGHSAPSTQFDSSSRNSSHSSHSGNSSSSSSSSSNSSNSSDSCSSSTSSSSSSSSSGSHSGNSNISSSSGSSSSSSSLGSPSTMPQAERQELRQSFPDGTLLQHQRPLQHQHQHQHQHVHPPASSSHAVDRTISPILLPDAALPLSSDPPSAPQPVSVHRVLTANLVAGSVAGGLAAALTTPFDVLKTRLQTKVQSAPGAAANQALSCCRRNSGAPAAMGGMDTLMSIWKAEGMRGLFAGVVPRAARAAPACAIVLSTYEVLKMLSD